MKDFPDDSAKTVSNGPYRLGIAQTGSQAVEGNLKLVFFLL
jgi:hypothetical protein